MASVTEAGREALAFIRKRSRLLVFLVGVILFFSVAIIAVWFSIDGAGLHVIANNISQRLSAKREQELQDAVRKGLNALDKAQSDCSRIKGHTCSQGELVPTFIARIPAPPEGRFFYAHKAWNWEREISPKSSR